MPLTGAISVFSTHPFPDPSMRLRFIIEAIHPKVLLSASRCIDRRWQEIQTGVMEEDEFEMLYGPVTVEQCQAFVQPPKSVGVSLGDSELVQRISEDVAGIDTGVRGDFSISSIIVFVGPHDLFEAVAEPKYFGRAYASVQVTGYGGPNDWPEARKQIAALPSVKRLEELCRPIMGEVQTCVFWDG